MCLLRLVIASCGAQTDEGPQTTSRKIPTPKKGYSLDTHQICTHRKWMEAHKTASLHTLKCVKHTNYTLSTKKLVSWCFEPSQPLNQKVRGSTTLVFNPKCFKHTNQSMLCAFETRRIAPSIQQQQKMLGSTRFLPNKSV